MWMDPAAAQQGAEESAAAWLRSTGIRLYSRHPRDARTEEGQRWGPETSDGALVRWSPRSDWRLRWPGRRGRARYSRPRATWAEGASVGLHARRCRCPQAG